jgi:hypothetical protein
VSSAEKRSTVPAVGGVGAPAVRRRLPRPVASAALSSLLADRFISICTVRAFLVLAAVREDGSDSGLFELVAQVGLPVGTIDRFLQTLTALGLVEQHGEGRRYTHTRLSLAHCVAELP